MAAREPLPSVFHLSSIRPDGSHVRIHPADVRGRFIRYRRYVFALLIAIYVALPLIRIGGHPAVHLDVEARRFFLFGKTFNAQDFWIVLLLVTALGFGLLFMTAWLGRVWCGWACPQTVFLEGVYRRIERWVEGPHDRRIKQDQAPWTGAKIARAVLKHTLFLAVSWFLAHVALAFFLTLHDLGGIMLEGPFVHPTAFAWAMAVTGALYFNYAFFREQLCVVVCPYGRLQSAMQDADSLIVGYDVNRGEPRGKLVKTLTENTPLTGDCVDCRRCIQVCPTGIDIRQGLQMECLACAQCIDACDEVMDKIGKPRGLIRYDSLNGLMGKAKRVARPRLYAYGALLSFAVVGTTLALVGRTPFEANLSRMPGPPYVLEGDTVRNQFELHLVNKNPKAMHFQVKVESKPGVQVILPEPELRLGSLEGDSLPIVVTAPRTAKLPFELEVEITDDAHQKREVELKVVGPYVPPS